MMSGSHALAEIAQARQLQTHLPLAALPSAVACARGHARAVALEWNLPPGQADTAELIVSELITNAIRASVQRTPVGPPVVRLWLARDQDSVVIRVWDASPQMPVRRDAGPDDEAGRGLLLVDALSTGRGAYQQDDGKVAATPGKQVTLQPPHQQAADPEGGTAEEPGQDRPKP
jgi:anti-sigma regulatory factor (Ser/Thr protein kinase)